MSRVSWWSLGDPDASGWMNCPALISKCGEKHRGFIWLFILSFNKDWTGHAAVMSNSMRPHRQQPTRLLCPWDSPGR